MWRKLRPRSRARQPTKSADASTAQPASAQAISHSNERPDPSRDSTAEPKSDNQPITRSPSLPQATNPNPPADVHAVRARTDMGTRADTSVPAPGSTLANHHHLHHLVHSQQVPQNAVHVPAIHPNPPTEVRTAHPTAIIPTPRLSVPMATPALAPSLGLGATHEPHRNRRLSLDGELPPSAIRPDDDGNMHDDGMREGVFEFVPDAFRPRPVDVAASSKAGWEPVRSHLASVPQMHSVEVRKENQDAYCVFAPFHPTYTVPAVIPDVPDVGPEDQQIFLGVFDGHGAQGRPIAQYARDYIAAMTREAAGKLAAEGDAPGTERRKTGAGGGGAHYVPTDLHRLRLDTLKAAFSRAERALTESDTGIDHVFSGTTAVVAWMFGRDLYTAWTGDSRCVIGRATTPENGRIRFKAVDLSHDQKPMRPDEKRRVRSAGGRIARWQRNVGPLRVWLPRDWTPGLAMTRSIGDTVLSEYGVSPVPEVTFTTLGPMDSFIVLASDGVWEFMTSQEVVDFIGRMRREGRTASDASESLVREAVRRWRRKEVVVDDTTAVVMWMSWEDSGEEGGDGGEGKKGDTLLGNTRKVFSKTRAKVSLKGGTMGVHLVGDDGQLADFVCKNDVFNGV